MATTIMTSTSVKPDSRATFALIFTVAFSQGVDQQQADYI